MVSIRHMTRVHGPEGTASGRRGHGGLGKRGHVVSAMVVSATVVLATVVGEITEVVGEIAEVVGKITVMVRRLAEVVGRLTEVVGVVADVVGEIAEVVGRVVASSGQLRLATACCGQLWLAMSGYGWPRRGQGLVEWRLLFTDLAPVAVALVCTCGSA